jgi:hypothetical protein
MKNEVYVPTCDAPISFEVANYVAQTRANGAFDTRETFGVNAWSAYTDEEGNTTTYPLMANVPVTHNGSQWTTGTPYYWPINGTVDFIAYYPTSVSPTIGYKYDGTDTYKYTDYTVGSVDLMYADKAIRFNKNNTAAENTSGINSGFAGVPTLFHHALAKVNFKVQNANPVDATNSAYKYEIIVNSITLKVYNQGTLTLTNDGTDDDASLGTWTKPTDHVWDPTGNLVTLTWEEEDDAITVLRDADPVAYADFKYVLPQTLEDDTQTITVDYTVIQKHNTTEISRKRYDPVTVDLKTLGLDHWQMNKNITYTISISKESAQILFAPSVEEWGSAAGAGSVTVQ